MDLVMPRLRRVLFQVAQHRMLLPCDALDRGRQDEADVMGPDTLGTSTATAHMALSGPKQPAAEILWCCTS